MSRRQMLESSSPSAASLLKTARDSLIPYSGGERPERAWLFPNGKLMAVPGNRHHGFFMHYVDKKYPLDDKLRIGSDEFMRKTGSVMVVHESEDETILYITSPLTHQQLSTIVRMYSREYVYFSFDRPLPNEEWEIPPSTDPKEWMYALDDVLEKGGATTPSPKSRSESVVNRLRALIYG